MVDEYLKNFVNMLKGLSESDNRGALASLRRGIGQQPYAVAETTRIVVPYLPVNSSKAIENTFFIIGTLYALHPEQEKNGKSNIGDHFRKMCEKSDDPQKGLPANIERRFIALLSSEANELPETLRQAVSLLKSKDVAVNWYRLIEDIQHWHSEEGRDRVSRAWSRAFWHTAPEEKQKPDADVSTE